MTWLSAGSLRLSHLIVHLGQTQPKATQKPRGGAEWSIEAELKTSGWMWGNVQRDDIGVGLLHSDTQRVLAFFIAVVLRGSPLQEQTHLSAKQTQQKKLRLSFFNQTIKSRIPFSFLDCDSSQRLKEFHILWTTDAATALSGSWLTPCVPDAWRDAMGLAPSRLFGWRRRHSGAATRRRPVNPKMKISIMQRVKLRSR